jgi:CBS-domain-containing membrane protein
MLTVQQLLPTTPQICSVTSNTPVAEAKALMLQQGVEHLLVLDDGMLCGMLTSQDCATSGFTQVHFAQMIPVSAVMRQAGCPVRPEATLAACAQQMAATHLHYLPVMDAAAPLGIVSLSQVTQALVNRLAEQEFLVSQLENYITGRRA